MRPALAGLLLIVVALWSGSAWAQDPAVVDKVVKLNKGALVDFQRGGWDGARQKLLEALVLATQGGLERHPVMARTYVHLGAVYIRGFGNREKALETFRRAFEIQSDIRLTKGLAATADVTETFDEAAGRPWRSTRPAVPGLECPVAAQTRVDQAVPVRCALASDLPVTKVFLLFREPVHQRFTEVEMKKTTDGRFEGRIPERVIYGESLQFYFEGRDVVGKPIVRNGDERTPKLLLIRKR